MLTTGLLCRLVESKSVLRTCFVNRLSMSLTIVLGLQTLQADEDEGDGEGPSDKASCDIESPDDDTGYISDGVADHLTPLTKNLHLTDQAVADDFDPCAEDVCGPDNLPGYKHLEELSKVLWDIALEEGKLAISNSTRQRVITTWNRLYLHDRSLH
ncbi:hypothetical protein D4764_0131890 [Takifugu flavidus]|uniref:Uncharacterized protein n=1 Tax=Takifugu flavidus TaxID=433684 RepID=A0A5C6MII0_9TELE|nr:hypothetical protein D4764_0131890 [Takifugu flavidus]